MMSRQKNSLWLIDTPTKATTTTNDNNVALIIMVETTQKFNSCFGLNPETLTNNQNSCNIDNSLYHTLL